MTDRSRVPPQNTEAEMCVLGSMIIEPEACAIAVDKLQSDDFYLPSHKILFTRIAELFADNKPTDLVILRGLLEDNFELDRVGGTEYLSSIVESVPTAANVEHYIADVLEKSRLRKIIKTAHHISAEAFDNKSSETIMGGVSALLDTAAPMDSIQSASAFSPAVIAAIKNRTIGTCCGYRDIDDLTNGFQPGDYIVLAARPSMGKTTLALNMLRNMAMFKVPVAFYSMEMSTHQIGLSLLSQISGVDAKKLKHGNVEPFEDEKLAAANELLARLPIVVDDAMGLTPLKLLAKLRRAKAAYGIQVAVVDYMQLMDTDIIKKNEQRQQEITYISRKLKSITRSMGIALIVLCQLSRAPEARTDHRPRLSDLRESGAIEQDADIVMFMYREEYYEREIKDHEVKKDGCMIDVAKFRTGETKFDIPLLFNKKCLTFTDPTNNYNAGFTDSAIDAQLL